MMGVLMTLDALIISLILGTPSVMSDHCQGNSLVSLSFDKKLR